MVSGSAVNKTKPFINIENIEGNNDDGVAEEKDCFLVTQSSLDRRDHTTKKMSSKKQKEVNFNKNIDQETVKEKTKQVIFNTKHNKKNSSNSVESNNMSNYSNNNNNENEENRKNKDKQLFKQNTKVVKSKELLHRIGLDLKNSPSHKNENNNNNNKEGKIINNASLKLINNHDRNSNVFNNELETYSSSNSKSNANTKVPTKQSKLNKTNKTNKINKKDPLTGIEFTYNPKNELFYGKELINEASNYNKYMKYEEQLPKINNSKIKDLIYEIKDKTSYGPYISLCKSCNKKNVNFYNDSNADRSIHILETIKNGFKKGSAFVNKLEQLDFDYNSSTKNLIKMRKGVPFGQDIKGLKNLNINSNIKELLEKANS